MYLVLSDSTAYIPTELERELSSYLEAGSCQVSVCHRRRRSAKVPQCFRTTILKTTQTWLCCSVTRNTYRGPAGDLHDQNLYVLGCTRECWRTLQHSKLSKMLTHCKDSMSCPIKRYTVHSRQVSENPPVQLYMLVHRSWERCAKSGTPCELFSSMDLH